MATKVISVNHTERFGHFNRNLNGIPNRKQPKSRTNENLTVLGRILDECDCSQGRFSELTGIDQATISRLCSGKHDNPGLKSIVIPICRTLGLSIYEVFPEIINGGLLCNDE